MNSFLKNERTETGKNFVGNKVLFHQKVATRAPQTPTKKIKKKREAQQRKFEDSISTFQGEVGLSSVSENQSLEPPQKIWNNDNEASRRLQISTPNSTCNGTWFHLHPQLDYFLETETNRIIANKLYSVGDREVHNFLSKYIENIPHRFILFDSFR